MALFYIISVIVLSVIIVMDAKKESDTDEDFNNLFNAKN
jgi:hypothetical protein